MSLVSFSDKFGLISYYQNYCSHQNYIIKFEWYSANNTTSNDKNLTLILKETTITRDFFYGWRIFSRKSCVQYNYLSFRFRSATFLLWNIRYRIHFCSYFSINFNFLEKNWPCVLTKIWIFWTLSKNSCHWPQCFILYFKNACNI